MAIAALEDPAKVASYEVKHRPAREWAALIGALLFVASGIWIMIDGDMMQKAVGVLAIAFFGWAAVVIVQRMRPRASVMLSHEGFHYAFAPNYGARKTVAWRDIEGFAVTNESGSEFNAVRLSNSDGLVAQFSQAEVEQTMLVFRRVMNFGGAAVVAAGANLKIAKAIGVAKALHGGGKVASIADMLQFNRQKFGGDILLAWPDRDRSAVEFHELLTAWKTFAGSQSVAPAPSRQKKTAKR